MNRVTVWTDDPAGGIVPGAFHWTAAGSQAPGRGLVSANAANITGSGPISPAIPATKTAYVVHFVLTAVNTAAVLADVRLLDGATGPVSMPFVIAAGDTLRVSEQIASEPHPFTTRLYLSILSGTVTWSAHACGYLV